MEQMDTSDLNEAPTGFAGKQKVTDMIDKRQKERQQNLESAHEVKLRNSEATESIDYFLTSFHEQVRDIQLNLTNMDSPDKAVLATHFEGASKSVQQLQLYLSNSTRFLPDSVIQRNQQTINELVTQLDAVKAQLLPKKKFGFRSSNKQPSPVINPTPVLKQQILSGVVNPKDWNVQNKRNQEILLEDNEVNGKDLKMNSLSNCLIRIVGHAGSLQLSNVQNCLILCGPVARSVFVENCNMSTLVFGCQQFRLHSSRSLRVYMHVTCRAIIEDCNDIEVAPYTFTYPAIDVDFAKAELDVTKNNWRDVADFNWLSTDKQSPHWHELDEECRTMDWSEVEVEFRRVNNI